MTNSTLFFENTFTEQKIIELTQAIRETLYVVQEPQQGRMGLISERDRATLDTMSQQGVVHLGTLPPLYPEWLGGQAFITAHHTRFSYIVGEMANGIATAKMVIAAAKAGMLGFFGAAGLMPQVVEENLHTIQTTLNSQQQTFGSNLIYSPHEPNLEEAVVNLYLRYHVQRVSASAYMSLSPHIVQYACTGLTVDPSGFIQRRNYVLAKISRPEVAKHFMSPAPADMLQQLVQAGKLTAAEANLAAKIPIAEDITVEADSGGHTDNRPLSALFPTIHLLAEKLSKQYQYDTPFRIGAAGGLGTPSAIAGAFSLGADYVLTGSINQAAVESGLSEEGRQLLAQADIADVMMAPAADMFELGVKLQILKRGTLFGARASKLYDLYSRYDSLEAIPPAEKNKLEEQVFCRPLADIWKLTQQYFEKRDPAQLQQAEKSAKHQMALVFRWYLGLSSHWAIQGDKQRKMDYQIWCGPAMGAFNYWAHDTFLQDISNRSVEQIGRNLLEGAAVITRAQQLRSYGFTLPLALFDYRPRLLS